ncbi:aggregation-promoting factor C-terminal-like domain-containing protein [Actinomadura rudentiformis]|uniref:CHAP domain-containing protein n=1 Tax=Actinomadura rudentiformis TaxID=359158 RepID=A0A6H9YGR3_9ACTN|nr:CHAP domain-containing protein [Actinomadura rudentiformis]
MSQLAGTAHILIRPDFTGFHQSIAAEIARVPSAVTIQVHADTSRAAAQLQQLNREVTRLGGRRVAVTVTANTGSALASIASLRTAMLALGAAGAPALLGIGAGLVGLAGPLAGAAAGFGALAAVAVPAITRVREALTAQKQAAENAAQAAEQAQARAAALASAQQQLANAVRGASAAHAQALDNVRQAEQALADAQRAAADAQRALLAARQDAARQLQDLSNQVANARLAERQAVFDLADAQSAYKRLLADPSATKDQIARAKLRLDQAQQELKERRLATQRSIADEKAARKAGVEGSDAVRSARDRLTEANRRNTESEKALAKARADVARTDRDAAEQVAAARRALAQAQLQVASSTDKVAAALAALTPLERQVMVGWQNLSAAFTSWGKQLQPSVLPALVKGIDLLRVSLPLATPLVQSAGNAVGGLVDQAAAAARSPFWRQFSGWLGQIAGPAITGLGTLLGRLVTGAAGLVQALAPVGMVFLGVLNQLAAKWAAFATGLTTSPGFQAFIAQMTGLAPVMVQAFSAVGSVVGNVFAALAPAAAPALGLLRTLATNLANLVRQIGPSLQSVLGALGPALGQVISALGPALGRVAVALAPVLVQLVNGLAPILSGLVPILGQLLAALAPVVGSLIAGLRPAITSLLPVVGVLAGAIGKILSALSPIFPVLGQFIAQLVSGLLPILTPIVQVIAQVAQQIAGALLQAIRESLPSIQQVYLSIASLLPALLPLIPALVQLVLAFTPLIPITAQFVALVVTVMVPILRLVSGVLVATSVVITNVVTVAVRLLASVFQWAFEHVIRPVLNGLAAATQWLYDRAKPLLTAIGNHFKSMGDRFRVVYDTQLKPVLAALETVLRTKVQPVFHWIANNVIGPLWRGIGSLISNTWQRVISPAFEAMRGAVGRMGTAFDRGASAIRTAWDKVKKYTRDPINFVIQTVYNKGVAGTWNKVMDWLKLPKSLHLGTLPMLASGGTLSDPALARPMRTRGPMAIVGEGRQRFPEYVIPTDPRYRGRAQALWASAGGDLQMLAKGGILGGSLGGAFDGLLKGVKNAAGKVFNLGTNALELLTDPKKVWKRLTDPVYAQARTAATSPFGEAAAALPARILDRAWTAAEKIIGTFSKAFGGGAGSAGRVIQVAKSLIGTGDRGGRDNNLNQYNGFNGEAWCADFISWVVDKANATRAYWDSPRGTPRNRWAAVAQWKAAAGRMLPTSKARPGDLAVYRGTGHINLVTANLGGGRIATIGGNEGPLVRASTRSDADGVLRPDFSLVPGPGAGEGGSPGALGGGAWSGGGTPSKNRALGRQMNAAAGWGGYWSSLDKLWKRESSWNHLARNPSSGAYGIPQSLPASKMASAGSDWRANPATQIRWGLGYISGRYGNPGRAWDHSVRTGWYDEGGWLEPGLTLVRNATGQPEPVLNRAQWDALLRASERGVTGQDGVHYHAHFDGMTAAAYEAQVRAALQAEMVLAGQRDRAGRRR